jgi:hypothetical protein
MQQHCAWAARNVGYAATGEAAQMVADVIVACGFQEELHCEEQQRQQ